MPSLDYSIKSYRVIIERALASGYRFVPFGLEEKPQPGQIYLRHDVDYSLELALKLAEVNAGMGVEGTFFVLLRSQVYNLLTPWSQRVVERIHELGQRLALHAIINPLAPDEVESRLQDDFEFARRNLPCLSPVFSWHNSTPEVLARTAPLEQFAGLINAYSVRFTKNIMYYSDSNMRHSADEFFQLVSARQETALQLLFHPLIWVIGGANMGEVFASAWQSVIKSREHEMSENRFYREVLPEGMPASVLTNFTEQLLRAMKR
jgi:hypothetical protein